MSDTYQLDQTGSQINDVLTNAAKTNESYIWTSLQTFNELRASNAKVLGSLKVNNSYNNQQDTTYGKNSISYYKNSVLTTLNFPANTGTIATTAYVLAQINTKINTEIRNRNNAINTAITSLKTVTAVIDENDDCRFDSYRVLLPLNKFKENNTFVDGFYMFTYSYAEAFVFLSWDMINNSYHIPIRVSMPVIPSLSDPYVGRPGNLRIEKITENSIEYLQIKVSNGTDTVGNGFQMFVYRTNLL